MNKYIGIMVLVAGLSLKVSASEEHSRPTPGPSYGKTAGYTALALMSGWRAIDKARKGHKLNALNHAYFVYHAGSSALKELRGKEETAQEEKTPSKLKLIGSALVGGLTTAAGIVSGLLVLGKKLVPQARLLNAYDSMIYAWNAKLAFGRMGKEYRNLSTKVEDQETA